MDNRLKLVILSIALIFGSFGLCFLVLAQERAPTAVIYLLDVSGSMKKGGLFENIKGRLKELVEEMDIGDQVVLITFGNEKDTGPVLDIPIDNKNDIKYVKGRIDALKAESPWTWMSKAFEVTKNKAEDIRAKVPHGRIMIYILTDCINDPPPHAKRIEPPWKFVEVLLKYFEDFEVKDTYIYLLSYRPLKPEEKKEIQKETDIIVTQPEEKKFSRILLTLSGFKFGEIDLSKGEVICSGEISVHDLQDVKPGVGIKLIPPHDFRVKPETIVCREIGQKESVSVTIPSNLQLGEYTEIAKLHCEKAVVEPSELKISFFVHKIGGMEPVGGMINNTFKMILPLLIFILLLILFDALIRVKTIWIEETGEERIKNVNLKGWKKVYLGERLLDEYVDFGLSKHYIQRPWLRNFVLLIEEGGGRNRIVFGEDMPPCKDPDGNKIFLHFYDKEPIIKEGPKEEEGEIFESRSDIFDRIEGKDE